MPPSRLIDDIIELAGIPAPTFAEERRLEWVEARLSGTPGTLTRDAAGNVVWRWGDGPPRVVVAAHVDTVFAEDTPLPIERQGDVLVGPGVGDNAAAVAVAIDVVDDLLRAGPAASGAVVFTVCEEGLGNLRGAIEVCEHFAPEVFIALEGHGLEHVIVDAVGSVRARVDVTGPGGHSWVDRGTPSAIHAVLRLGDELAARDTPDTPVNVGLISGGRSVNAIAEGAALTVEMRALDEPPLDAFATMLAGLTLDSPLQLAMTLVGRRPAGRLDRTSPLLGLVREARAELGLPDRLEAGSTDANAALARGIPAVTLGVSRGSGMHSRTEQIEVAALDLGRRQLAGVLRRVPCLTDYRTRG